jgi:hypothetical protein
MPTENNSMDEDRFGRQDQQRYSGWTSLVTIGIIVIVLGVVFYFVRY